MGDEFRVNESVGSSQNAPAIVGLGNGGFVIAWGDNSGRDGSGNGVWGQQYDAAGNRVDGEFLINSETASTQSFPALAALGSGNFVAVWESATSGTAGDGSGTGIFQQLFGAPADFATQASPELGDVHTHGGAGGSRRHRNPQQLDDGVSLSDADSADFDGGFVEVIYLAGGSATDQLSVQNQGVGPGQIGVAGNVVSYEGTAIGTVAATDDGANGGALRVALNAAATVEATQALIEALAYQSTAATPAGTVRTVGISVTDGDGGRALTQSVTINVAASVAPATVELLDLRSAVTFSEDVLQAGAQRIDASVDFDDNGSPGFGGGSVVVTYAFGGATSREQLGVSNTGTDALEIGVSGSDITFGGTLVGTIDVTSNGINGAGLTINLNGSADAAAIEALIESLTYQNLSDVPVADRTLRIVVTDGSANATSTANTVVVSITPDGTGPQPVFGERQVNSFTAVRRTCRRWRVFPMAATSLSGTRMVRTVPVTAFWATLRRQRGHCWSGISGGHHVVEHAVGCFGNGSERWRICGDLERQQRPGRQRCRHLCPAL